MPGLKEAWSRLARSGEFKLDEGLTLHILGACARNGEPAFAHTILRALQKSMQWRHSGRSLQEWHRTPIFEAYCAANDWTGAMRALGTIRRAGIETRRHHSISLATAIRSADALQRAAAELEALGKMPEGVDICAFNGVLSVAAQVEHRGTEHAVSLFQNIGLLNALRGVPGADGDETKARRPLTPNAETYEILLTHLIHNGNILAGRNFFKTMQPLRLRPTGRVYEKMIVLELTNRGDASRAFDLLEEAKEQDIVPTQSTYEALITRCIDDGDEVRADMLREELRIAGHGRTRTRATLDRGERRREVRKVAKHRKGGSRDERERPSRGGDRFQMY